MKVNPVRDRSYAFALAVIRLYRRLPRASEMVLGRQLVRAGTSVGANVEEAPAAHSRRDFVSKLSIARKEARECHYWLRLLRDAEIVPIEQAQPMIDEAAALIRILTSIILSTRQDGGGDS